MLMQVRCPQFGKPTWAVSLCYDLNLNFQMILRIVCNIPEKVSKQQNITAFTKLGCLARAQFFFTQDKKKKSNKEPKVQSLSQPW